MVSCDVRSAVEQFYSAKSVMLDTFGAKSTIDILVAVREGAMPRYGTCRNGWGYLVHGSGYTVVLPFEVHVHIDSGDDADVVTVYDIQSYLKDIGCDPAGVPALAEECRSLVSDGLIGAVDGLKFSLTR